MERIKCIQNVNANAYKVLYCNWSLCVTIRRRVHRRITKFMYSMIHSDNDTVKLMTPFFLSTEASFLAENFRYIMYTYKITMFAWYKELSVLLKCITYVLVHCQILN